MSAITAAATYRESSGSTTLHIYTFTSIADTDTFASGLGTNVLAHWFQGTGNPSTQTSAGCNVANSSGTFTFYPSEDSLAGTLFVLAKT